MTHENVTSEVQKFNSNSFKLYFQYKWLEAKIIIEVSNYAQCIIFKMSAVLNLFLLESTKCWE